MKLLARVLQTLEDGYDDLRTIDGSEASKGVVSFEKVIANWRYNSRNKDHQVAGVCRDIAMAGVKIAKAMGIKISYALGYQTAGDGHHRININSKGEGEGIILYNYGEGTQNTGIRGVKALEFNGSLPSTGIKYRIYNVDSRLATILPSELGVVLNEVMGGADETLTVSPLQKPSLHQVGARIYKLGRIRGFSSNSTQGELETTHGIAYDHNIELGDHIEIGGGASAFSNSREGSINTIKNDGVALRISSKLKLEPEFKPTKTKLKLHVTPQFIGTWGCTTMGNSPCDGNTDSHTTLHYKGELAQGIGDFMQVRVTGQGNMFTTNVESTDIESPREFRVTNYSIGAGLSFFPTRSSSIHADGRIISTDLGDAIYKTFQGNIEFHQDRWQTHLS